MNECYLIYSANMGISLTLDSHRIWMDFLHNEKTDPYSIVSRELCERIFEDRRSNNPEVIYYTHTHPDHYSKGIVDETLNRYPKAYKYIPIEDKNSRNYGEGKVIYTNGELNVESALLPHEENPLGDIRHEGCMISYVNLNIINIGDCSVCSNYLGTWINNRNVDVCILPFMWVTLKRGREFIEDVIKPKLLIVCHLPFYVDDYKGYRELTEKAINDYMQDTNIEVLKTPLQKIDLKKYLID